MSIINPILSFILVILVRKNVGSYFRTFNRYCVICSPPFKSLPQLTSKVPVFVERLNLVLQYISAFDNLSIQADEKFENCAINL